MHSKIQICNQALLAVGTRTITSFEEPTPEARYCQDFWDMAVLNVLRDHPWGFAQKRAVLAELEVPPGWKRSYCFAYAYPNDCLQAHALIFGGAGSGPGSRRGYYRGHDGSSGGHPGAGRTHAQDFIKAADDDRTIILCNIPRAVLSYTAKIEDVARFDSLFAEALVRKLQCMLLVPIKKTGGQDLQAAETLYARALAKAQLADAKEGRPYNDPDELWIDNPWAHARMRLFGR